MRFAFFTNEFLSKRLDQPVELFGFISFVSHSVFERRDTGMNAKSYSLNNSLRISSY